MKNKRQLTYLIIFVAVALISIIGATYAYFESTTNLEGAEFNVQAITAGSTSFTGYSTGNIEFNVAFSQMSQANVSDNIVATDNALVNISLESENENVATTCTYDLVWVWESDNKYTEADTDLPYIDEQVLADMGMPADQIEQMKTMVEQMGIAWEDYIDAMFIAMGVENGIYKYEMSVQVDNGDEIDLSKLTWNGNEAVVAHKSITSMAGVKTNHNYEVKVNVYNIPVVQNNLHKKNFQGHIEVRNSNCTSEELNEPTIASTLIKSKYTSQGANGIYLHNDTLTGGAGDSSYRYAGANPDNYVCFEGDDCLEANNQYRIIGVFADAENGDQVKLIKRTNLAYMPWDLKEDESYANTWDGSTLERYLNSTDEVFTYYTLGAESIKTTTTEGYLHSLGAKTNMIASATWSVGGASYNDLQTKSFKEFYDVELNNSTTYSGKIGLMYITDYLYSALPGQYSNIVSGYPNGELDTNNWLRPKVVDWTISRSSDSSANAFGVGDDGGVSSYYVGGGGGVRPSFNLTSSVKIKMGSGTADDPYIIGL